MTKKKPTIKLKKAAPELRPCVDNAGRRFRPNGQVYLTACGSLALHNMRYLPKFWAVTHIKSGCLVAQNFRTATEARLFLQNLLVDAETSGLQWSHLDDPTTKQYHNAVEILGDLVARYMTT